MEIKYLNKEKEDSKDYELLMDYLGDNVSCEFMDGENVDIFGENYYLPGKSILLLNNQFPSGKGYNLTILNNELTYPEVLSLTATQAKSLKIRNPKVVFIENSIFEVE